MLQITRLTIAYNVAKRISEKPKHYIPHLSIAKPIAYLADKSEENIKLEVEAILAGNIVDYVYYLQEQKTDITDTELLAGIHNILAWGLDYKPVDPNIIAILTRVYLAMVHTHLMFTDDYLNYSVDISLGKR